MALVKERHNPNDHSQMFTFFDNVIGTTDFEEGDSSEKSGGAGGGGGGFTKNFGISRSSSTISSPNSMNSGGLAHRTSNNYHQHEAEGHSRSVMTFKPEYDNFMQLPAANGPSSSCFLRFDEQINDDEQAYSGLDHPSHELNSGSNVRLLESFNSIHTSTSGIQENHHGHGEMDLFGWANSSNPQQQNSDHDHHTVNGDHVATQESAFHNKRPHPGESMQANKKQCTTSTKKGKPKSTSSQPQSSTKDPQSIAAKNRRERISERLKVLQDLVPNGSKVDLVTMLEKAISYVKFLQLQVKVLATDEFWPVQGGKAPELSQVKEAIDAILSASQRERNNSASTVK